MLTLGKLIGRSKGKNYGGYSPAYDPMRHNPNLDGGSSKGEGVSVTLSRRGALGLILAAPAIVRATSLMPIKAERKLYLLEEMGSDFLYLYTRPDWALAEISVHFSQVAELEKLAREEARKDYAFVSGTQWSFP